MSVSWAIVIGLLLLAANAFFVAGEFCVTTTRRSQIDPLVEAGNKRAKTAVWALEHVSLLLAVTQLGITLASTGLGAVAEPAVASLIEKPLHLLGVPASLLHPIAFCSALVVVVFLHIFLGEMIPKNLTVSASVPVCLALAPMLVRLAKMLRWIVEALNAFANWILRYFGVEAQDEVAASFTLEEVASIVEQSEAAGTLSDDLGLLSGSLEFSKAQANTIMVPLAQLSTIAWPCSPKQLEEAVAETGFSRFLVWEMEESVAAGQATVTEESRSKVVASMLAEQLPESDSVVGPLPVMGKYRIKGYLHIKDVLLPADSPARFEPIEEWRIRELPVIDPEEEIEDALRTLQRSGVHLAQVVRDQQVLGIVFVEDILEELVGEVRDSMQRNLR